MDSTGLVVESSLSDRWEKDYAVVRDEIKKTKKMESTKVLDAKVKQLEVDLKKLADDGTLVNKKLKLADLARALMLRGADKSKPTAISSFSSSST